MHRQKQGGAMWGVGFREGEGEALMEPNFRMQEAGVLGPNR